MYWDDARQRGRGRADNVGQQIDNRCVIAELLMDGPLEK